VKRYSSEQHIFSSKQYGFTCVYFREYSQFSIARNLKNMEIYEDFS